MIPGPSDPRLVNKTRCRKTNKLNELVTKSAEEREEHGRSLTGVEVF
jgi:hypothetical protein